MALVLTLRTNSDHEIVASFDGRASVAQTPAASLPTLEALQQDAFTLGRRLTQALGGAALTERLDAEPDNLLLLDCDDAAQAIPWEYAALPDHQLLAVQYGLLRLVDRPCPPAPAGPLNFVALAADPLVDEAGNPRVKDRLDLDNELRSIRNALANSNKELAAQRIPPTQDALRRALYRGPAVLHLTCHGGVIPDGSMAVLLLEDADGAPKPLLGRDLLVMPPRGVLRAVLLSACHTSSGATANLARALVRSGVPFAIGMQGEFPDPLSDDLAVAFYEPMLAGLSLAEALRMARQALLHRADALGLVVGYAARDGWKAVPMADGRPQVGGLGLPGNLHLSGDVQPPRPLLGRNRELHDLAALFSKGIKVVTVNGGGGMGKTALAASFTERFAWRWPQGVRALSFASSAVDAASFRLALARELLGEESERQFALLAEDEQTRILLATARDWDGLLLVDNYETVQQDLAEHKPDALAIHRLLAQLAAGGAALLLTSRDQQPAGLPGEVVYPGVDEPLAGLDEDAGAKLFMRDSARAGGAPEAHSKLARQVAHATEGHALAISLLAGEYDTSVISAEDFLRGWPDELARAVRPGLAPHQITFALAFRRSYDRLAADEQRRLRALSAIPFAFFAFAARIAWGLPEAGESDATARDGLAALTRRNLLQVDGRYTDGTPATYRFQPALRQEVLRHVSTDEQSAARDALAAYSRWLVNYGYDESGKQAAIARMIRDNAAVLIEQVDAQPGDALARYCWRLGNMLRQFGRIDDAQRVLDRGATQAQSTGDLAGQGGCRYEQANIAVLRGQLDKAMALYEQSIQIKEQLGDLQGQAATLHEIANVWVRRGQLDKAMALYEQSIQIKEQLGDLQGQSATLHAMANVWVTRGQLDQAMALYEQSIQINKQLGDLKGKSATLHQIAGVWVRRGQLDKALALYEQSIQIEEQLGDLKGKSATLHQIANVWVRRGQLDKALALYEQSIQIEEQLGDLKGQAATLHEIANVWVTRGQLDKAMALYEQSIQIKEQLGDLQGKSATLGMMANVYMARQDWDQAERVLQESLALAQSLRMPEGIAFATVKLGQAAEGRGDRARAAQRYREGLALHEQLGMPAESAQVRGMIAAVEGTPQAAEDAPDPLRAALAEARIQQAADQARDAAMAALRGQADRFELAAALDGAAAQAADGEADESPWRELAAYLRALAHLMRGETVTAVPAAFAAHFAAAQAAEQQDEE